MKSAKEIAISKEKIEHLNFFEIPKTDIKDIISYLYYDQDMSVRRIAKFFNLNSPQPIITVFKKFGLKTRSEEDRIELRKKTNNEKHSKKKNDIYEIIKNDINDLSILQLSEKFGLARCTISTVLKERGHESEYFVNEILKDEIFNKENDDLSAHQLSLKYNVDIAVVKYYKKDYPKRIYSRSETLKRLNEYDLTKNIQGITKKINLGDPSLYDSVLRHTEGHTLWTDKFVEKMYRLLNNFKKTQTVKCKHCHAPLKFYGFTDGYGGPKQLCKNCVTKTVTVVGRSKISQKMFWEIYEQLDQNQKDLCQFGDINKEKYVKILKEDKEHFETHELFEYMNYRGYLLDFSCGNKVIEFDGRWWHSRPDRRNVDEMRDIFLSSKGYSILRIPEDDYRNEQEETVQKCLEFLRS